MRNCSEFESSPTFFIYALWTGSLLTTPVNLFGIFCIIFKTPTHQKDCQVSLLFYQIPISLTDFILSVMETPVLYLPLPLAFPNGLFRSLGVDTQSLFVLTMCVVTLSISSILQLFYHRLRVISPPDAWFQSSPIVYNITVVLLFSFAIAAPFFVLQFSITPVDFEEQKLHLAQTYSCASNLLSLPYVDTFNWQIITTMAFIVGVEVSIVIILSGAMGYRTYRVITTSPAISERTRQLQKKFQLSICCQVLVPVSAIALSCSVFSLVVLTETFGLQVLVNLAVVLLSCVGFMGTTTMIAFNTSYMSFVNQIIDRVFARNQSQPFSSNVVQRIENGNNATPS